ncbi:MAG: outer membrane beta-barrel protein [Kordiimonas sp.]
MKPTFLRLYALLIAYVLNVGNVNAQEQSQPKLFDGLYGGIEISMQNIYGGAFLDNVDVLQEDTRAIGSIIAGWRKQFDKGLVIGIEGQFGLTDGNLRREQYEGLVNIDYANSSQIALGIKFGYALGVEKDWLLFGYTTIARRSFDITVSAPSGTFSQEDIQGILQYGVGIEKRWKNGWGVRATAGTVYTDFGDLVTNIDVTGKIDTALALTYQF